MGVTVTHDINTHTIITVCFVWGVCDECWVQAARRPEAHLTSIGSMPEEESGVTLSR